MVMKQIDFYVSSQQGNDELKCIVAFEETSTKYNIHAADKTVVSCSTPYVQVNGNVIFSANAICKYIAHASKSLHADDLMVDEWIEWEENQLKVAVLNAKKSGQLGPLETILQDAESKFQSSFLFGESLSLADIVIGITLKSALDLFPDTLFLPMRNYVETLFKLPSFNAFSSTTTTSSSTVSVESTKSTKSNDDKKKKKNTTNDEKNNSKKKNAKDGNKKEENGKKKPKEVHFKTVQAKKLGHSLLDLVREACTVALFKAYPVAKELGILEAGVTRATNAKFGDFQCNSAMSAFKLLKSSTNGPKSPQEIGQALKTALESNTMFKKLEVLGPGFVNLFLSDEFVQQHLQVLLREGVKPVPVEKLKIAVDFSSPNIAKDMHVGHLRSTIIGDAMCRILEFQGHEVCRINHLGDWGTQFGMLICHIMDQFPDFESNIPNIQDLTLLYKAAKKRFDDDLEFKERSRFQVTKLQSGDPISVKLWTILCDLSKIEFDKVYDRLNVKLEPFGESFYNDMIPGVIDILEKKNLTVINDGALVVPTEVASKPLMMKKSDGSYLYDSTDMAAVWYRTTQLKADWLIYYTDFSQNDHFTILFEACRMAELLKEDQHRVDHIGFGTVNDESGHRFKTRDGDTVRLVDLLDEAKNRMKAQLIERIEAKLTILPMDKVEEAAEAIGYGAVKYFDLRQSPTSNYIFSFDRMLSTNGDTAVYLLFAYARLSSIIRKSGVDMHALKQSGNIVLSEPSEWALGVELLQFQDVIHFINRDLMSNRLCSYLYDIAEKVQTFVTACKVIGSPEQSSRLLLCQGTVDVMFTCFNLLGIKPLDQI